MRWPGGVACRFGGGRGRAAVRVDSAVVEVGTCGPSRGRDRPYARIEAEACDATIR